MDPLLVLEVLAAAPLGCVLGALVYAAWQAIRRSGSPDQARDRERFPV
jgi:hypothetical protein